MLTRTTAVRRQLLAFGVRNDSAPAVGSQPRRGKAALWAHGAAAQAGVTDLKAQ